MPNSELTTKDIEAAVESGLIKALGHLGLPVETVEQRIAVQQDFAFMRAMRLGTNGFKSKSYWLIFAAFLTAICGFVWAGLQAGLNS